MCDLTTLDEEKLQFSQEVFDLYKKLFEKYYEKIEYHKFIEFTLSAVTMAARDVIAPLIVYADGTLNIEAFLDHYLPFFRQELLIGINNEMTEFNLNKFQH